MDPVQISVPTRCGLWPLFPQPHDEEEDILLRGLLGAPTAHPRGGCSAVPAARGLLVLCRLLPSHSQHPSWSVHCVVMAAAWEESSWQGPERHTGRPRSPPSRKKGAVVTGSDAVSGPAQPPTAEALRAGWQPGLGRGLPGESRRVCPMICPDHLPARTAGSSEGSPGQEGPLSRLLHLEGQGRASSKGMDARRGHLGGILEAAYHLVPWD